MPPKRLGSLSSFQPTLSFGPASSSAGPSTPRGGTRSASGPGSAGSPSSTGSSSSLRRSKLAQSGLGRTASRDAMPPPPLPFPRKGKGRATDAEVTALDADDDITMVDDDDDVITISSDDEPIPAPAPRAASNRKRSRKEGVEEGTTRAMWTDVYAPTTEAELAPGKARIGRVKDWLSEAIRGVPASATHVPSPALRDRVRKYRRILLITGPAGIGKTTTLRLLMESMGVELVEWTEGVEERSLGTGFENESSISKFSSFLSRHAYPPLSLGLAGSQAASRPRVLLMTSLPNLGHLPTREAFHAALLSFCRSYNSASSPLVIVQSDAGSGGRAEDSWMGRERGGFEGAAEILGREVRDGPWCSEIDFLPLAITFITKALSRVLSLAVQDPARRPSQAAVQLIGLSANGDLRSAINSLQVLCTGDMSNKKSRGGEAENAKRGTGKGSRGGRGAKLAVSDEIRRALDAVTRREQSLNLFHALGRVMYNKRLGDPPTDADDAEAIEAVRQLVPDDPLPRHLREFERRKSMVQMEDFIPTIPVDASTFALWIHHNVPQFTDDVDEMAGILDDFCAADLMRTDDDIWQSNPQAIAYALHLAVRSTLLHLPSPVARRHQKVLKPEFFDAFRLEKSNGALLDSALEHVSRQGVTASIAFADGKGSTHTPPWGGISSKAVLAETTVPMALKIQQLARHALLPAAVDALALQVPQLSQHQVSYAGPELAPDGRDDEDDFDAAAAGEDGLGAPAVRVWGAAEQGQDYHEQQAWKGETEELEQEPEPGLDDDIEDWSD